ncbi:MAG: hypothetical protein KDJ30_18530, partial [Rhodoblastus sp.]|nr:hypothetical protein [Rhodoblastus sp.]
RVERQNGGDDHATQQLGLHSCLLVRELLQDFEPPNLGHDAMSCFRAACASGADMPNRHVSAPRV